MFVMVETSFSLTAPWRPADAPFVVAQAGRKHNDRTGASGVRFTHSHNWNVLRPFRGVVGASPNAGHAVN
jgi:hypothetical protein